MFEIREVDLAGRTGKLYTSHGVIETPAFFPVVDVLRQELPLEDIRRIGFNQIITNAYLLYRRFGRRVVEAGLHRFLGWDGPVMTDSGAYQLLEYGRVLIEQEEVVEYQARIGSDIAVILDIPTGDASREEAEASVEETIRRAREAIPLVSKFSDTLWVLPVQGGRHLDLVRRSAEAARQLSEYYSVYAIGSPTVFLERYKYGLVLEIVAAAKRILPGGKPVHLFGAGHPLLIPYAVALGIDMFDSASYILYARDGRFFTDFGVERLERADLIYDPCLGYIDARDLSEAPPSERTRKLALHNLCMIRKSIEETKTAIREGRLWELLEALSKHHPSTYESLISIINNIDIIERSAPRVKGIVRGVKAYDLQSYMNPRLSYYRRRLADTRYPIADGRPIMILPYPEEPEECSRPKPPGSHRILYVHPFLSIVPEELCGVFPTIHVSIPDAPISGDLKMRAAQDIARILSGLACSGTPIVFGGEDKWGLIEFLRDILSKAKCGEGDGA